LSLHRLLRWVAPGLALPMLALTLIPGETWSAPAYDETYGGFDANLVSTSAGVHVTPEIADVTASADSISTINLATTLRRKLAVSLDATVLSNVGAVEAFRIGPWSPWTGTGYFVAFGPAPSDEVSIEKVSKGSAGATLLGGEAISTVVGHYVLDSSYHVAFLVDRTRGLITTTVAGPGANATASLSKDESPGLFSNVQLSLTASTAAGSSENHVLLTEYSLVLPHERVWSVNVNDPVVKGLTILLATLGIIALLVSAIVHRRRPARPRRVRLSSRFWWLAIGGASVYVAGNLALFQLGGHPFDFANEQLYAYVAKTYGPTQLYFVPDVTSLAATWSNIPWIESSFPYQPVIAYLFTGIGWLSSIIFAGAGAFSAHSAQLGYAIKSVNVAFGLADGALIYLILRDLNVGERWSRIGAAFFLFNPAVWFSMSIWGQTHVFSIFFVLLAILFAQRHMPFWAWLALAAATLTRPQMVAFALLLGVAFLRKFTWRENLAALSWTVIVIFVALIPLTLMTSPSLPVDIMLYVVRVQEAGGNQASLATVSQSAYSVWPLVTYIFHGASGVYRAFTPSANTLIGSITYQQASQVLTLGALIVVTAGLFIRKRFDIESGGYLPLVAVGVTSFFLLLTGVVATHFLLALPLLLLCRRWMGSVAYCFVVAAWSISTLVPMYGDMGDVISSSAYPLLAPANNPVTRFFVDLYVWDRFITVAIVANICVVIWLAVLAYRPQSSSRGASVGAAV
jgi:hypothetical protein